MKRDTKIYILMTSKRQEWSIFLCLTSSKCLSYLKSHLKVTYSKKLNIKVNSIEYLSQPLASPEAIHFEDSSPKMLSQACIKH